MPAYIEPDDGLWVPMIAHEDETHIVVTMEIPKHELKKMTNFLETLLAIVTAR